MLLVVGDVPPHQAVVATTNELLGGWVDDPRAAARLEKRRAAFFDEMEKSWKRASSLQFIHDYEREDALVLLLLPAPRPDRSDDAAFTVALAELSSKRPGGLFDDLRERNQYTYGVGVQRFVHGAGAETLISAPVKADRSDVSATKLVAALHSLGDDPLDERRLRSHRQDALIALGTRLQSNDGVAEVLADEFVFRGPAGMTRGLARPYMALQEVSAEEVQRVARRHLNPNRAAVLISGPHFIADIPGL
jgi:predicted Zn-dependent peptidase